MQFRSSIRSRRNLLHTINRLSIYIYYILLYYYRSTVSSETACTDLLSCHVVKYPFLIAGFSGPGLLHFGGGGGLARQSFGEALRVRIITFGLFFILSVALFPLKRPVLD